MTDPTARSVTVPDPEMAANSAQDSTVATASPPGTGDVASRITVMRRSAMSPRVMRLPARM